MIWKWFVILTIAGFALAIEETDFDDQLSNISDGQNDFSMRSRRSTVEFMGMRVSYPQYVRLRAIQREVVKMDQTIRHMVRVYSLLELAQNPHWIELLELYDAMRKMLPQEYLESVGFSHPIPI